MAETSPMRRNWFAAGSLEYRFRFALHGIIFFLCFWCPWIDRSGVAAKSVWLTAAQSMAEHGWMGFFAGTDVLLVLAMLLTGLGALFRVWGTAYVGAGVVGSPTMHGETLLADGPYRRTRNPLYLGTLLHTLGISLLMPVSGAIACSSLIWMLQFRLALAEEPFLFERFGAPYAAYVARVPRFLPAPRNEVPAAGQRPRWMQALLGEVYFVGVFLVLATVGWQFNAQPILLGVLVSLGLWLVIRMLQRRAWIEAVILLTAEVLWLVGWDRHLQLANKSALMAVGVLLIVMGLRRPANAPAAS